MTRCCMIVETELALHREVIAGALAELRPEIVLETNGTDDNGAQLCCQTPRLVIASDRGTIARLRPYAWILLFPGERDVAIASIGGRLHRICAASIDDLIAVIDEVWRALPAAPCSGAPRG